MRKMSAADHYLKLMQRIEKNPATGCWEWTGPRDKNGYGQMTALGQQRAHRLSYMFHRGEIPEGMFVCHHCDNPPCVNPDHLYLGSPKDNMRDKMMRGRFAGNNGNFKTRCKHGHEYDVTASGKRLCRECSKIKSKKFYLRNATAIRKKNREYYKEK